MPEEGGRVHPAVGALLAALLTVFALAPLTYPGFFEAHGGFLPSFNVQHLDRAPYFGRAVDLVRGEGKLPYLLAWPFFALSGSGVAAIKWGYGLAFLLGALGCYAWTRRHLAVEGGGLASAVYTYLPWHLGTVYVRGAYAEAWLWAIWPWTLWAVDRMHGTRPLIGAAIAVLSLGAAQAVQPGMAVLFLAVALVYAWLAVPHGRRWPWRGLLLGAGLLVVLVAARLEAPVDPWGAEAFLYPFQLLSAAWGDVPGMETSGVSFQLGFAATGLSLMALALWLWGRKQGAREGEGEIEGAAIAFWAVIVLVVSLMTLRPAAVVWRVTALDRMLGAPWQVLALAGPGLAFLAGATARLDRRLACLPAWAGLCALVIVASYPYLEPRFTRLDPGPEPVALLRSGEGVAPDILLLESEILPPSAISPTLTLTLTWQALAPVKTDYTVFAHLLAGERRLAQGDGLPCGGECPTSTWQAGRIFPDRRSLTLPADAPPGPYRLAVGLYRRETGERAAVVGREDGTVYLDVP